MPSEINERAKDQECQVDFIDLKEQNNSAFICNRFVTTTITLSNNVSSSEPNFDTVTKCDAEMQASYPVAKIKVIVKKKCVNGHSQCPGYDKEAGNATSSFKGHRSLDTDYKMNEVAGVDLNRFKLLLSTLDNALPSKDSNKKKICLENRLLIFLMKMKLGITFAALSIIFGIHCTTVSRIFHENLDFLVAGCKNLVFWPSQYSIKHNMPECFKTNYENCRVLIDATEFRMENPAHIDQKILCYSNYKKGYRLKVVIGCSPDRMITFISAVYGGRASDVQITTASELLKLLEPGDIILADKGFPNIQAKLEENGNNVIIVMPPFVKNGVLSEEEVKQQYDIASVRIHIERIMQRIRIYKILELLTSDLVPHIDNILFMCCALVNLQPPIIK